MASLNYGLADVGMIGLRDVLVVAPPASFHSPHHHHAPNDAATTLLSPAEHPVIPLLAAAPCLVDDLDSAASRGRVPTGMNLWQNQHAHLPPVRALESHNPIFSSSSYFGKPTPVPVFDATSAAAAAGVLGGSFDGSGGCVGGFMGGAGTGGVGPSSSATCQDCGNQAKKDCSHRRCRTCCKSRGFDCASHVKSTWVPAARRRERQASAAAALPAGGGAAAPSSASTSAAKKPRLLASDGQAVTAATASRTSTSNTTPRSLDTGSSHQDPSFRESLPGQVRTPAVFRCVRVTTVDDGEDELAYQAMVNIGGHIFKGFLYDQGVAEEAAGCGTSGGYRDGSNNGGMPNISELHLGGAAPGGGPPTYVYADAGKGGGGLMGSTAYGNPIN